MNIEKLDNALSNLKVKGQEHIAACPVCESNNPKGHHLYYRKEGDKILMNCKKSGCSYSEIINTLGIKENTKATVDSWEFLREHYYHNTDGIIIAKKIIYHVGKKKTCVWERCEGNKYIKGLNKMEIPLYNFPAVVHAASEVIYIVEGEKDVDTIKKLGYLATTSPNGASCTWNSIYNKYFAGKNIVIIPDHDVPGKRYAENIVHALLETAKSIKVIDLVKFAPALATKGDISDVCSMFGEDSTKALLTKAVKETEEIKSTEAPNWLKSLNGKSYIDEVIFTKEFKEKYNLVCINDTFYDFHGRKSEGQIKSHIQTLISAHFDRSLANKEKSIFNALKNLCYFVPAEPVINEINCLNTTLVVAKNKELSILPLQFALNRLNVYYNPEAGSPEIFIKYLNELLHEEDIPTLQEYLGYCLLPTTIAQKCLCIIGSGGEGKSKIGALCNAIFGETMINDKIQKLDEDRFIIPQLENKNLFYDDDLNTKKLAETGTFKNLVTNELHVQGEKKGVDKFRIKPYVKFLMCGNSALSSCFDKSDGFYRRLIILKCKPKTRSEDQDDHFLSDKLIREKDAIFLWMLEGLQRVIDNDFNIKLSKRAEQNLQQAKEDDTNIISFMKDDHYIIYDVNAKIHSKDLLSLYKIWCLNNAEVPLTDRTFLEYLKKSQDLFNIKYSEQIKMSANSNRSRGYEGLRIGPQGIAEMKYTTLY